MKKLLKLILIFLASVLIGLYIKQDSGYILISFHRWIIEFSLWTGVLLLFTSFFLVNFSINIIRNIINLPKDTLQWFEKYRRDANNHKTSKGLIRFAEGNFKKAESLLIGSADKQNQPIINYLVSAIAAQKQGNINTRDEYLRKAFECSPDNQLSIGLMQANLQISNSENEAALATLNSLLQKHGYNKTVFKQLLVVCLNLKDWNKLLALLPDLNRYSICSKQELLDYEILAVVNYLAVIIKNSITGDPKLTNEQIKSKIDDFYNHKISKKARQNYQVVIAYIEALNLVFAHQQEFISQASDLLLKTLKNTDDKAEQEKLIDTYEQVVRNEEGFAKLEKYLILVPHHLYLLFTLGKMAISLHQYEKAYQYLHLAEQLAEKITTNLPIGYYLSYVLARLGRFDAAINLLQHAFKLHSDTTQSF